MSSETTGRPTPAPAAELPTYARANLAQRGMRRFAASRAGAWLFARTLHHVDRPVYRLTRGRQTFASLVSGPAGRDADHDRGAQRPAALGPCARQDGRMGSSQARVSRDHTPSKQEGEHAMRITARLVLPVAAAAIAALAITPPALAGTVQLVSAQQAEYVADAGEENDVNLRFGATFDPTTGGLVQGFIVRDSAGVTAGAGCRSLLVEVICESFSLRFVSVDLRDGNDRALVDESSSEVGGPLGYFLDGDLGSDTLVGGSLSDLLLGNAGNDHLEGGGGNDTVQGGTHNDTVLGQNGNDLVTGYLGDDTVEGGRGDDDADGGGGGDTVRGDGGLDDIQGGPGPDLVYSRDGVDEAPHCGLGQDRIDRDADDDATSCEIPL